MKDKKILVLVGGPSKEAEISRRTGSAIAEALRSLSYDATCLELVPKTVISDIQAAGGDIAFIAVHGKYGEDGALQGALEMAGIPYTGSGVMAHAVGMNKKVSKYVFAGSNIPSAPYKTYMASATETADTIAEKIRAAFTGPIVLKPATQGSSLGVTILKDMSQLDSAVAEALTYDPVLVVEQFLDGGEFTVGVLDGQALPVIEIRPHSGAYDYSSKYTVGATDYLVPAPIDEKLARAMQDISVKVYEELQCQGVARVDIMTDRSGQPYVLEINTVPGMTATSLVPKAAAVAGLDFPALCERILQSAGTNKF